jgi:glycerol-3-phosphate acyltransferase PlsY
VTILLAALAGYLIGSLPTADLLARLAGVDLRRSGSGNPGTLNALRSAGARLAVPVLAVELVRGIAAVAAGRAMGGEAAGFVAGAGAIAGNIYNPYYRFRGGKGLAITGGVTLAAWPAAFLPLAAVLAIIAWLTRSPSRAAMGTLVAYVAATALWVAFDLPTAWGIRSDTGLMVFGLVVVVLVAPKFLRDEASPGRAPAGS